MPKLKGHGRLRAKQFELLKMKNHWPNLFSKKEREIHCQNFNVFCGCLFCGRYYIIFFFNSSKKLKDFLTLIVSSFLHCIYTYHHEKFQFQYPWYEDWLQWCKNFDESMFSIFDENMLSMGKRPSSCY